MLLQTVRGRAGRVAGHTFEERLRGAFPYDNGYVTWDIADDPYHSDPADDQPEP